MSTSKKDSKPEEPKMSFPMSEKDEVKEAERRTQKAAKAKSDPSVKADLKNRSK